MLALVCCTVSAQDIILKKNADEIQAKVLKVTETEIEYKKWENLDGPIYTIPANEIFIIKYQNGSKDIIRPTPPAPDRISQETSRNIREK